MDHQHRHRRLLRLLAEHGAATVHQLADWLDVSPATARRDIRLLDVALQLRRVHGGARRLDTVAAGPLASRTFAGSLHEHGERKRAIARRAVAMCADGDTVLVGGGTTTFHMAPGLAVRPLRIVTNSFEIARQLLATSDNEVILAGGKVYPQQGIVLSPFDTEAVQYCHAHWLFLGIHGLSALGLMEVDPLLIQAGRRLIRQAQQVVVLADSSKFARRDGMFLCALANVACVITDTAAPDAAVQMLERAGVRVVLVDPEAAMPAAGAGPRTVERSRASLHLPH